jgi:peptidoglycan/LPS O-acetylase OafA/YrhL
VPAGQNVPGRFAPFDGLRALAVLAVLAVHLVGAYIPGGWVGVDVFFALSGYLITMLLLREHARTGGISLRAFYLRRILRLAPALTVFVAVVAPIAALAGQLDVPASAAAAITYTMDIYKPAVGVDNVLAHTWSLAVEEQFYVAWPVVLVAGLARGWRLGRIVAAVAGVAAAAGLWTAVAVSPAAAYYGPFAHLPVMLGGVALALVAHHHPAALQPLRSRWVPVLAAAGTLAVLPLVRGSAMWLYGGGLLAVGAVAVALIGHLHVNPDGWTATRLQWRPLVWLGERSYGFYLWHFPVTWVAPHLGLPRPVAGLLALIVILGLTQASWLGVERPFLRLKDRIATRDAASRSRTTGSGR